MQIATCAETRPLQCRFIANARSPPRPVSLEVDNESPDFTVVFSRHLIILVLVGVIFSFLTYRPACLPSTVRSQKAGKKSSKLRFNYREPEIFLPVFCGRGIIPILKALSPTFFYLFTFTYPLHTLSALIITHLSLITLPLFHFAPF